MKSTASHILLIMTALSACVSIASTKAHAGEGDAPAIWLIGDSTVRNGHGDGVGWGEVFSQHFDTEKITIHNRAIGGRSSRTFRTEGRWDKVLDEARPGDFVLMQFGHNDGIAPDDPERPRGSLPGISEETRTIIHPHTRQAEAVHTYGWYMRQYVIEARDHGLVPIVCSYVPRAPRKGQSPDPDLTGYALWAAQIAEQEEAAFMDLFGTISRAYQQIEYEQPHAVKDRYFVGGDRDYTHTNRDGAEFNSRIIAELIRRSSGQAAELAQYLINVDYHCIFSRKQQAGG